MDSTRRRVFYCTAVPREFEPLTGHRSGHDPLADRPLSGEHTAALAKAELGHGPKEARANARAAAVSVRRSLGAARRELNAAKEQEAFAAQSRAARAEWLLGGKYTPIADTSVAAAHEARATSHRRAAAEHLATAKLERRAVTSGFRSARLVEQAHAISDWNRKSHTLRRMQLTKECG